MHLVQYGLIWLLQLLETPFHMYIKQHDITNIKYYLKRGFLQANAFLQHPQLASILSNLSKEYSNYKTELVDKYRILAINRGTDLGLYKMSIFAPIKTPNSRTQSQWEYELEYQNLIDWKQMWRNITKISWSVTN